MGTFFFSLVLPLLIAATGVVEVEAWDGAPLLCPPVFM
jgi:hypothetical protein